jgi:hypothetical protein
MPCSDSSSSIAFKLDADEKFIAFEFAKITCGREITAQTGYSDYCKGKSLTEILDNSFEQISSQLRLQDEESQFILYLEWDGLRSAIIQYLGDVKRDDIDQDRCRITSIEYTEEGVDVGLVILPPKELPKILPCSISDKL